MIKSTRLTLVPSTPFFEAVTEALGDPDSAEDNQVVVGSIAVSPDKTGEIMAGEEFHLTVNYAMNAVPPYSYNGGTVSLYTPNEVKRGTIILTVPRELVLPQQAVYRQEVGESAIYNIPVSDESASGKMVLKAYFAGNGRSGIGTAYEMSNICRRPHGCLLIGGIRLLRLRAEGVPGRGAYRGDVPVGAGFAGCLGRQQRDHQLKRSRRAGVPERAGCS